MRQGRGFFEYDQTASIIAKIHNLCSEQKVQPSEINPYYVKPEPEAKPAKTKDLSVLRTTFVDHRPANTRR